MTKVVVEIEDIIAEFEKYNEKIRRLREALREYTCDCERACQGIRGEMCGSKARAALEGEEG